MRRRNTPAPFHPCGGGRGARCSGSRSFMGLLGLLSLLHSAFFGNQVGCRESWSELRVWGEPGEVLTVGMAAPRTVEDTHARASQLDGSGVFHSCSGDSCQGNLLSMCMGLGFPPLYCSDPSPGPRRRRLSLRENPSAGDPLSPLPPLFCGDPQVSEEQRAAGCSWCTPSSGSSQGRMQASTTPCTC